MQPDDFERIGDRIVRMTDDKIIEMHGLIQKIYQRQEEVVMRDLEELKKDIKGNGKKGLLDRMTIVETGLGVVCGLATLAAGYIGLFAR